MSLSHLISRTLSLVDMNVHEVAVIDLTDVLLLGGLEGSDGCLKASIGAFIFASVANSSEESSLSKSMSELAQLAVAALESSNGSMSSECQSREYIEAIAVAVNKVTTPCECFECPYSINSAARWPRDIRSNRCC